MVTQLLPHAGSTVADFVDSIIMGAQAGISLKEGELDMEAMSKDAEAIAMQAETLVIDDTLPATEEADG